MRIASDWDLDLLGAYRVTKMAYRRKGKEIDKSEIRYNAGITLEGIPEEAHEYQLGSRSALDWLVDRYEVKTDNRSGITNNPNDWADELEDSRYILDLLRPSHDRQRSDGGNRELPSAIAAMTGPFARKV